MVKSAIIKRSRAALLTFWIGADLVRDHCTMADGCRWLLKPCVEPVQNIGTLWGLLIDYTPSTKKGS